jgi:hypothetical protein
MALEDVSQRIRACLADHGAVRSNARIDARGAVSIAILLQKNESSLRRRGLSPDFRHRPRHPGVALCGVLAHQQGRVTRLSLIEEPRTCRPRGLLATGHRLPGAGKLDDVVAYKRDCTESDLRMRTAILACCGRRAIQSKPKTPIEQPFAWTPITLMRTQTGRSADGLKRTEEAVAWQVSR